MTEKRYRANDPEPPPSVTVLEEIEGDHYFKYLVRQGDGWIWNSTPTDDPDDTPCPWGALGFANQLRVHIEAESTTKLAFVGPEPEPAEAPAVTTPFRVDRDGINYLRDSRGSYIGEISSAQLSVQEDGELADLIVRLLNEHFGAK